MVNVGMLVYHCRLGLEGFPIAQHRASVLRLINNGLLHKSMRYERTESLTESRTAASHVNSIWPFQIVTHEIDIYV